MASDGLPDGEQAGPSWAPLGPLPGTFMGPALDIRSESLYELVLLHDMGEEELPFVSLSELDYLRRIWPRAVFAFMTQYQQDLERKRK